MQSLNKQIFEIARYSSYLYAQILHLSSFLNLISIVELRLIVYSALYHLASMNIKRWKKIRTGMIVGFIGGYLYYYYYGCTAGACHITSSPVLSPIYGMAVGALIWDNLNPDGKDRN